MAFLIFIIIVGVIIYRSKRKWKNMGKVDTFAVGGTTPQIKSTAKTNYSQPETEYSRGSVKGQIEKSLRDNTTGDWLAMQMAEERRSYAIIRDMFQLRSRNIDSTDAELLRRVHQDKCESGTVDTAKGK